MRSMKFWSLPLAAMALSACGTGDTTSETKIINGTLAPDGGAIEQSTVALASSNGQVFCTGTLIDKRFVVSAGHCLANYRGTLYIGFGRSSTEFKYVKAADYAVNPAYTGSFNKSVPSDISVIELSAAAPAGYNPVAIYKGSITRGSNLALAGFGQTQSGGSGRLYYTSVSVSGTTSNEITVYENGTGSCYGDSGGPAYVSSGGRLLVIGATSRGETGCRGSSIYTNVAYHLNWLRSWTGVNL
ncbi:MAG TPA: trypsin-like serine protease [Oligoflexus sp.]|uniref:S1 family peptidase n=1 Tax=Oligoflexus sp. TaxID=1971216 RepID=UPI002D7E2E49|nr:trypsin-like serine protease [Oligoflexus sp.]HET9237921.1 trypsin-like serine protease [Oligoflexus sp.]